jgi:hypothetical protein
MLPTTVATLYFILSLLTTIVHGCPPPLNNFKYADNNTLLRQAISQHESAHVVGGNSALRPWPTNAQGIVVIPFCFVDVWVKHKIEQNFQDAWERWYNKIGDPKPQTGHRLGGFQELKDRSGNPIFCYRDQAYKFWNPKVPGGTLQIKILPGTGRSQATMGFFPPEWSVQSFNITFRPKLKYYRNNENDRHEIRIGWHNNPMAIYERDVLTLSHEMGHVFGLQHEHQRPDRKLILAGF